MTEEVCLHYLVSGLVQGVGYRYFVKHCADQLNLNGWARNLDDGRVEVVACANEATLAQLERRLREGPPGSQVADVTSTKLDSTMHRGFSIRY